MIMSGVFLTELNRLRDELHTKSEEHALIQNQLQGQIEENKRLQSHLMALQLEAKGKGPC